MPQWAHSFLDLFLRQSGSFASFYVLPSAANAGPPGSARTPQGSGTRAGAGVGRCCRPSDFSPTVPSGLRRARREAQGGAGGLDLALVADQATDTKAGLGPSRDR